MSEIVAEETMIETLWHALESGVARPALELTGVGTLNSAFAVSELAAASIATAGLAATGVAAAGFEIETSAPVRVDRSLACAWFGLALRPVGWELPSPWDALAGDYETADGWIRLHTNAPHHRAAALAVLDTPAEKADVAAAVRTWRGEDLEIAIVSEDGCAAVMKSEKEWARHPQGSAVATEPLIAWEAGESAAEISTWEATAKSPLAGLRVLDLTRVIAGPVATRFLAGLGADVLRIDPPDWDEPAVAPDMTLGKRAARLDARTADGRARLRALIANADIFVHGYRADALDRLGLDSTTLQTVRPGLVEVALNAYGWAGPWRNRRGFDSLVQMSVGIAEHGMRWASAEKPIPLPVQALDHATGYLAAAAALTGLRRRTLDGTGSIARLSLARTALALSAVGEGDSPSPAPALSRSRRATPWGAAELLKPPVRVGGFTLSWKRGPRDLGTDDAVW